MHALLTQLERTVQTTVTAQKSFNSSFLPLNELSFLVTLQGLGELMPLLYLHVAPSCPRDRDYTEKEG